MVKKIRTVLSKVITGSVVVIVFLILGISAYAENAEYSIQGLKYEKDGESAFDVSAARNTAFSYGKSSLGSLTISGEINEEDVYNNVTAYGADDVVTISYIYDGSYHTDNKDQWNLEYSDAKSIKDYELDKKIQNGVVIVEKSTDGITWTDAAKISYDYFKKANSKDPVIYTTTEDEIMQGTYYKVTVAYQMRKRTSVVKKWGPIPDVENYAYKSFIEEYTFFVCTVKNHVTVKDIESKSVLQNNAKVSKGFIICKNNSYDDVMVTKDLSASQKAADYDSFTTPGIYTVEITTKLKKVYKYTLTVSEGLSNFSVVPQVYESKKNSGFIEENMTSGKTSLGINSLTSLKISQRAGFVTTKSQYNGFDAYGVNGDVVSIFLKMNYNDKEDDRDWEIVEDTWGKKEKEKVNDVFVGAVGEGALIIQTSTDGKTWVDVDKDKYASGLYTTDFAKHYSAKEDVLVYTPKGTDILSGVYIRIYFAYQALQGKTYTDCLEKYEFYLCSNELSAVTFPNLTIKNTNAYSGEDKETAEVYKAAETLTQNAGTVTGFGINGEKNPTVTYTVKKDGKEIQIPENKEFTSTGKYEITLTSAVKDQETLTIYVDTSSDEQSMRTYFGSGFIQGKRIYDEGDYPVYEAGKGLTSYHTEKVGDSYLPIFGVLKNETTGKEITFEPSRNERNGDILEAGEYTAIFKTGVTNEEAESGDVRVFSFRFSVIESGTAPGPVINHDNLLEFARTNISDCYPIYYGVTYPSAKRGYITLAFAEEEDAIKFAYAYEKGMVEIQEDGTYRYNGSTVDGQKESFDSIFDLTEAANDVSEKKVKKCYFDLRDVFTYTTLENEAIRKLDDLRAIKLDQSIIVFADKQKEALINKATDEKTLPVISVKRYVYVQTGDDGEPIPGENDFEFIHDKYGCDSNSVTITDKAGKVYNIRYNQGVAEQLEKQGCPSGIVTITETTVYGDTLSYKAVYIKSGDNTSTTQISYYEDGIEKELEISVVDNGKEIDADLFSVESLVDDLDPYSLITVSNGTDEWFYSADQVVKDVWSEAGEYKVSIVNRLGYGYSFSVNVRESDYSIVSFAGEGTDDLKDLVVRFEQQGVELPIPERYGYEFDGYEDLSGRIYSEKIDTVLFKKILTLKARWKAKDVAVKFVNADGFEFVSENVPYNSVYILPTYEVDGDYKFQGWSLEDAKVEGTQIRISTEEDMIFKPVIINKTTGDEVMVNDISKAHPAKVVLVIIILFATVGGGYITCRKKMKGSRNEDTKEDRANADS